MKKRVLSALLALTMTVSLAACSSGAKPSASEQPAAPGQTSVPAQPDDLPTIGNIELLTGSATGSWYTIGAGIADKFNEMYNGFPMTAIPGPGSIGNAGVISAKDAEIGMSYGPFLAAAVEGAAPYDTKYENLRSICVLQPTVIQPMTTLEIDTLGQFFSEKIKGTMGVYPVGNASTYIISLIFEGYGINDISEIEAWGAKSYHADGGSLADAWADRHIDIQMPMLNVPASTVTEALVTRKDGKMLSLDDDVIKSLTENKGFQAYTIPAGTYEGQTEDCKTVGLPIVIFTTEDADDELIYNFTKSIYENKDYFLGVHSSFAEFEPETMMESTAIELHSGAVKFYQEAGLM